MKKIFFPFLLSLTALTSLAQKVHVDGFIQDAFTGESLFSVKVSFLNPKDSTLVFEQMGLDGKGWNYFQFYDDIKKAGKYILKFEKEGYYTTYQNENFDYKKNRRVSFRWKPVKMRKLPKNKNSILENELGEATVVATKVKMIMKGDTIVYNADAFELANGSMLDKLIEKLPGVSLERNGQIYVNGQKVQSLLVNGEDFFRGDPEVALDNLPAYMVDKVKSYRRLNDRLVALGVDIKEADMKNMPLVIDVQLKKEYSVGWVGNIEGGYGTDNHYLARIFGLRFTPRSRLAFVGNANDVKGSDRYQSDGAWQSVGTPSLTNTQEALVDYLLTSEDKKRFKLTNTAAFKRRETNHFTSSSTTHFMDGSDIYSRSRYKGKDDWHDVKDQAKIYFTPRERTFFEVNPQLRYYRYHNQYATLSADFSQQLAERYMGEALDSLFGAGKSDRFRENLITSLQNNSYAKGYTFNGELEGNGTIYIKPDFLTFALGGKYNMGRHRSLLHSSQAEGKNPIDRFGLTDNDAYQYHAGASYQYAILPPKHKIYISPSFNFTQSFSKGNNDSYLLSEEYQDWDVDKLASNKNNLLQYMDWNNANYSKKWGRNSTAALNLSWMPTGMARFAHGSFNVNARFPLRIAYDKLDYQRGTVLDTLASRRNLFFEPELGLSIDNRKDPKGSGKPYDKGYEHHYRLNYKCSASTPHLLSTLNYVDSSQPLTVIRGNARLKNEFRHTVTTSYNRMNYGKQRSWDVQAGYTLWRHAQVQSMSYDVQTGIRTYQPQNIEGNWQVNARFSQHMPLDLKRKHWELRTTTTANFRHSADLLNLGNEPASSRHSVDHTLIGEDINLKWSNKRSISAELQGSLNWTHATSNRLATINAFDFSYGGFLGYWHRCGLEISTNLRMYSRRGYSDNQFNTNQFIWNASVSQSALKGRLNFKLSAFDILNKLSSYSYTVNAQMQQETFSNVLRRYVMLSITYKINRERKKQK